MQPKCNFFENAVPNIKTPAANRRKNMRKKSGSTTGVFIKLWAIIDRQQDQTEIQKSYQTLFPLMSFFSVSNLSASM